MKRSPSLLRTMPPSPRAASLSSTPSFASPVGWNWNISMSSSGTPRRHAIAGPSPVEAVELVEEPHVALHALLVQRLQDHVAGAVGGIAGPPHRTFAMVRRVAA